ncbi:hypothetical protein F9883_12805 [Morganella morganii]|uniref:colicin immunity domain-containing protein n=1 Tax=Morganella morganii TaxID=582 RepID=UPI001A0DBC05|nr:colicin immunity domain-containing protein [Morganella morganii]MBA5808755.1 hypothetical protein [Morganella morganii]
MEILYQDGNYQKNKLWTCWRKKMYSDDKLLKLINDFIHGSVTASDFENDYINEWRNYRDFGGQSRVSESNQEYFDRVFTALDIYCSNPDLRDENDFDDDQLLNEIIKINKECCLLKG